MFAFSRRMATLAGNSSRCGFCLAISHVFGSSSHTLAISFLLLDFTRAVLLELLHLRLLRGFYVLLGVGRIPCRLQLLVLLRLMHHQSRYGLFGPPSPFPPPAPRQHALAAPSLRFVSRAPAIRFSCAALFFVSSSNCTSLFVTSVSSSTVAFPRIPDQAFLRLLQRRPRALILLLPGPVAVPSSRPHLVAVLSRILLPRQARPRLFCFAGHGSRRLRWRRFQTVFRGYSGVRLGGGRCAALARC